MIWFCENSNLPFQICDYKTYGEELVPVGQQQTHCLRSTYTDLHQQWTSHSGPEVQSCSGWAVSVTWHVLQWGCNRQPLSSKWNYRSPSRKKLTQLFGSRSSDWQHHWKGLNLLPLLLLLSSLTIIWISMSQRLGLILKWWGGTFFFFFFFCSSWLWQPTWLKIKTKSGKHQREQMTLLCELIKTLKSFLKWTFNLSLPHSFNKFSFTIIKPDIMNRD